MRRRRSPLPFRLPRATGHTQLRRELEPGTARLGPEGVGQDEATLPRFVLRLGMDAALRGETKVWGKWFHTAEVERSQTAKPG